MSAENVDLVRRWCAVMSKGPTEAIATVPEFWDAEADYHPVRKFPDARPSHGRQELSDWLGRFFEGFPRTVWAINELVAVGDDRVLGCVTMRAEGPASGLELAGDLYQCFWLRGGRFVRVEDHMTLRGALAALGLEGATLEAAGLRGQP
jgi:SnoaL-like domain